MLDLRNLGNTFKKRDDWKARTDYPENTKGWMVTNNLFQRMFRHCC